ncbi:transglutaminaseTgpA domain-containing protein [Pseudonocardia halophobica]|uniref:transglutaminase family protein n=1 Tax=Pseudonocardia halophobica TaxID=29401 RepID=UPI003D8C3C9F
MSTPTAVRPAPPAAAPPPGRPRIRWVAAVAAGLAVLLAGTCLVAVVQGGTWFADGALIVAVVVGLGIALQRLPAAAVAVGQLLGALLVLTGLFGDDAVAGFLPGPAAFGAFADHVTEAAAQIDSGVAPVVPTAGMLFLITAAFGLLAVIVHAVSVSAGAPAAAGVPLLCMVAVPAALSDALLPWWAVTSAVAGYGLLLVARDGAGRRGSALVTGGIAVVAVAGVLGLLLGSAATVVGTAGRFVSGGAGGGSGGAIGLNPFTSLRGQLTQSEPVELFRTTGLPRPTYLRALTLSDYRANSGWQAATPRPGVPLAGPLTEDPAEGERVQVAVQNVGFRDYWLPLYGQPESVTGVDADRWAYDRSSGIAYTPRPREEEAWQETAVLPAPSADDLRSAAGPTRVDPAYRDTAGVDPRVAQIAADVTRDAGTPFDKAIALVEYFTGPQSQFRYSLETAPGSGDDALVDFLTVGRAGYCEQFASAMAVMLRTQGVPARVAVGFTAGTEGDGYRSVSTRDAHAWVEAWFPGHGWTTFDPTPLTDGRTVVPPYVLEAVADAPPGAEQPAAPQEEVPQPEPRAEAPQPTPEPPPADVPQPDPTAADQDGGVPVLVPLVALLVVALLAGPSVARRVLRKRRLAAAAAGGPGAGRAAWDEVLATSRDRGSAVSDGDTVRGTARTVVGAHELDGAAQDALREIVRLVEAEWYGDEPPAEDALTGPLQAVLAAIGGSGRRGWKSWVRTLAPRSLLTGLRAPAKDRTPAA